MKWRLSTYETWSTIITDNKYDSIFLSYILYNFYSFISIAPYSTHDIKNNRTELVENRNHQTVTKTRR